jgi:hypothetical protein
VSQGLTVQSHGVGKSDLGGQLGLRKLALHPIMSHQPVPGADSGTPSCEHDAVSNGGHRKAGCTDVRPRDSVGERRLSGGAVPARKNQQQAGSIKACSCGKHCRRPRQVTLGPIRL